jgi:hypothetical protein
MKPYAYRRLTKRGVCAQTDVRLNAPPMAFLRAARIQQQQRRLAAVFACAWAEGLA